MTEVPVPEGFGSGAISVAGTHDHDHGEADVNVDDVRHCRDITVPDDAESVGVSARYASEVAAFLGVALDDDTTDADVDADASDTTAEDDDADPGTCTTVKADGDVCGRELPCPYHSE